MKANKKTKKTKKTKVVARSKALTKFAKSAEKVVRMRIICIEPLDHKKYNARFGIQDENRSEHKGKKQSNGNICYDIEARAKYDPETKKPIFFGPWVNGTPDERFLYLAWTPLNPNSDPSVWHRRMKVHLSAIRWKQVEEAERMKHGVLEVNVPGKDQDGAPACASVPLLGDGWIVREIPSHKPIKPTD